MSKPITISAGIDTGKHRLDAAIDGSKEQLQVDNTPEGHKALSHWLRQHRVERIGIEASGGYEQAAVRQLRQDRCRPDRELYRRYAQDPCGARSTAGAFCRASDDDRADRRGHRPHQDALRVVS